MTRARDLSNDEANGGGATPPVVAGKNGAFNGAFDFWQRGTSFTTNGYAADRWYFFPAGVAGRTCTRQSSGLTGFNYCARVARNSGETGTTNIGFAQSFATEEALKFAGQTVTFSFYARAGANYSPTSSALTPYIISGTGTDQSRPGANYTGETIVSSSTVTLTTTWQRFTKTATFASTITEFALYFEATPTGTAGAADYFEVTGVQLEVGSVATPFARAGGTIQGELAACQRYYYRANSAANLYTIMSYGYSDGTTTALVSFPVPSYMRIYPSSADYSTLAFQDSSGGLFTFTGLSLSAGGATGPNNNITFQLTGATGMTQGRPGRLLSNNSTSAYLGFSAEL
jgi:hypothetical protein